MQFVLEKFKEIFISVIPIVLIVLLLHFFVAPLDTVVLNKFLIGSFFILLGMPVFLIGVDISITPMGEKISGSLLSLNKLWWIILGGIVIGFIVTIAEPDLHILSAQVRDVTSGGVNSRLMLILVSGGVGFLVAVALVRVLRIIPLNRLMTFIYLIIFILAIFSDSDFLAIAFDASGSTTGSVSVPFLLALSIGASNITRGRGNEETDSFGMLGIASTGAIIAVLLQGVFSNTNLSGTLDLEVVAGERAFQTVLSEIPSVAFESFLSLFPVLILFLIVNFIQLKESKKTLRNIFIGTIYTYLGLILFLTGVNGGFIEASRQVGFQLASLEMPWLLLLMGVIFGIVTIPAEPSVHILTSQIENETAGAIKSRTVLVALSIGVGLAVGFSILRILIPALELWHILLPGMAIVIILSYFISDIFVGIAYDSGGVAAGTMTATFLLPYAQGTAQYMPTASVVTDGFGVITIVALIPLLTVEILGLIYKISLKRQQRKTALQNVGDSDL
ncbi:DUF1538 domain-containing protein [Proteiniphilum sp.]|uniref:DUF1538 domain-containing protein n=1 Tax=Proteiniphilum sp. TaxID=1926877 RepID=UPI002B1FFA62|nr:DUF1538 domain-containing protein [Proteiniphilum sp.]MEA4918531.1 DUF1538 domain-containing protein [Proteiniphilum sp.]